MKRSFFALLSLSLVALPALAAGPNIPGSPPPAALGQHSLSEIPVGVGTILYAPSEDDDAALRADIAAITGGTVDYFDARAATPTLAELEAYDCVYTWANFEYLDNVLFGDNLADYVDGGGHVVLGVFTTFTSGNFLDGRIMTADYSPVVGGTNWFISSSYAGDGQTSIYDGVTDFECTFRDILSLQGEGVLDGTYVDGEMAHAYNPGGLADGRVVYSNGAGAAQLACTGDWAQLVANACMGVGAFSLDDIVPAIAGQENDWLISGATPNDNVGVICRPEGGTSTVTIGTAVADGNGDAVVTATVPAGASGKTLQCAARDTATSEVATLTKTFQ